jgi:trehalose-phosphatase
MRRSPAELASALEAVPALVADARPITLFLDYDGTLTEIVARPEEAVLSDEMRAAVRAAAATFPLVGIVSGRDRHQVEGLVGLPELAYVGSHGFDIAGPKGTRLRHEVGHAALPALDAAEAALRSQLAAIAGAGIERKRFSVAVHFRRVDPAAHALVERGVDEVVASTSGLRKAHGKAVFELQPDVRWDKGRAVLWLLDAERLRDSLTLHLGDDLTDESVFAAVSDHGAGILVGGAVDATAATLRLRDPGEVLTFLRRLVSLASPRRRQQQQQQ